MRSDHSIFQAPLSVDIVLDADHPYEGAKDGQGTWLVHSGEFGKGCDVGMVSDGHGFEDSPDCERISGGVNSKGPMALAIGRQANLLHWGFYGAPDRMTEAARRAFLNAIVYMKQFDGQVPLVKRKTSARTWLVQYIDALAEMKPSEQADTGKNSYAGYLRGKFPPELLADGIDADKLRQWYAQNEEYFRADQNRELVVDEDLRALGLSNRKPAFLDWVLATLARDVEDETGAKLARRYLGEEHGISGAAAVAWITANRPFLFFTDVGGYQWMVDVNAQRAVAAEAAHDKGGR